MERPEESELDPDTQSHISEAVELIMESEYARRDLSAARLEKGVGIGILAVGSLLAVKYRAPVDALLFYGLPAGLCFVASRSHFRSAGQKQSDLQEHAAGFIATLDSSDELPES